MRVMYIEQLLPTAINDDKALPSMSIGDVFNVTGTFIHGDREYYFLAEFGNDRAFRTTSFATLPDTPAEVIEEKETEYETA